MFDTSPPRAATERPSVSAVLVNYNGGDRMLTTLQALHDQVVPLDAIIVVDNGSDDGSPERIRVLFSKVEVLEMGRNLGLPAGRNVGLRRATSDFVLLVDSDVYVEPECIARLLRTGQQREATVICPRIRLIPEREIVQADGAAAHFVGTMLLRHAYRPVEEILTDTAAVGGCIGACMLVDRRRVLDAGGFDEMYFLYFEDLEFSLRLRALGHRFVCEPTALAFHDRGSGTPGLSYRGRGPYPRRRAYLTLQCRWATLLIHYRLRTLIVLGPALLLYELASLATAVVRGWGLAWLRACLWHVGHARTVWQRRRRAQRARTLDDRDLLVGGPLPLAPGLIRSRAAEMLVRGLSGLLNGYWRLARPWIG